MEPVHALIGASAKETIIASQTKPETADLYPLPDITLRITPTDIAGFIRQQQCARYLRLRMNIRTHGETILTDYGVVPQSIPPLMRLSGSKFEDKVGDDIKEHYQLVELDENIPDKNRRPADNDRLLQFIHDLEPGQTLVLSQVRIETELGGWNLRGDMDLLRLERDPRGKLSALIADVKSSRAGKLEHRLQVAFYVAMLAEILKDAGVEIQEIGLGVLYRGPVHQDNTLTEEEQEKQARDRQLAVDVFGVEAGFLEISEDPSSYLDAVEALVTGPKSTARQIREMRFQDVSYDLGPRCDGCIYQEFCMKWSAEHDDLSLIPHLTTVDKGALQRNGIITIQQLADLKIFDDKGNDKSTELVPAPEKEDLNRQLATTWPLGGRIDELVHRAKRYRKWRDRTTQSLPFIPNKGYTSLPHTDATQNPNLVTVYIDAQHDYLNDRIYLIGSRVVAYEGGEPARERSIVHMTDVPPDTGDLERDLLTRWLNETLGTIVGLAAPDANGEMKAPIHLIFYNRLEQNLLLNALARHSETILGATPLYDFLTQMAAYDSPIASYLEEEIRDFKNIPMVCQSLHVLAAYMKFNWDEPQAFRDIFRTGIFDFWGKLPDPDDEDAEGDWYFRKSRFSSQIPLEYAYAAWNAVDEHDDSALGNENATYEAATPENILAFQARRIDALQHIAGRFQGNKQTTKTPFDLPDLGEFEEVAGSLAGALDEFVTIERHVELADWKAARYAPPERRALSGDTLVLRYRDVLQDLDVRTAIRESRRRSQLREQFEEAIRCDNPDDEKIKLSKDQKKKTNWSYDGLTIRFEIVTDGLDCDLDELLSLTNLREGGLVVIFRRWDVDSRLPEDEQVPYTPTAKQILYGSRGRIERIKVKRDKQGRAESATVEIDYRSAFPFPSRGFVFSSFLGDMRPLEDGEIYSLDSDPNSYYGYWSAKVAEGVKDGNANALYDRLTVATRQPEWPAAAAEVQARFLTGLQQLDAIGALHPFEVSKQSYIAQHGDDPTLLVQGPPGTGKSYASAYALFARLQGAFAAGIGYRVLLSCKTHAATDELLKNVAGVQSRLAYFRNRHPDLFHEYFDERLIATPLYRINARGSVPEGVTSISSKAKAEDGGKAADILEDHRRCIAAATPGGAYALVKDRWGTKSIFGHEVVDCLVLDEASQLTIPEAMMAALPLKRDGWLIVVGDHRQMPPIIKHAWDIEPRRTVQQFKSYESLFAALLSLELPVIRFEESFRLHADMAEYLRQEIYQQDGIPYYSRKTETLKPARLTDEFVAAVLDPDYPIVVIVHDEAQSQHRNPFEQDLIAPILHTLATDPDYQRGPVDGLGVVVPHRAQRAALQDGIPALSIMNRERGTLEISSVDTVERFQGGEREVIFVTATESDRDYLLQSSKFLLDPRRLTVALSRAKHKLVLVASRSIFNLFTTDEEVFEHALLWKHLLHRTCTEKLWEGERQGHHVEVWGKVSEQTNLSPATHD